MRLTTVRIGSLLGRSVHEPYFDKAVQEFALNIPKNERIISVQTPIMGDRYQEQCVDNAYKHTPVSSENTWGKIVLRRAALGLLPLDIVYRQKQDAGYGSGAHQLEKILADELDDAEYISMSHTFHPFYNKAHAQLCKIYYELGLSPAKQDAVSPMCNWCGGTLEYMQQHCMICGAYDANLSRTMPNHKDALDLLKALAEVVPLFRDLPQSVIDELDPGEFLLPIGEVERMRNALETETGQYVMTYQRGKFLLDIPARAHLCNWLKQAPLTAQAYARLQYYEEEAATYDVSFVLYKKPLEIMPPSGNPIAQLYLKHQQSQSHLYPTHL